MEDETPLPCFSLWYQFVYAKSVPIGCFAVWSKTWITDFVL